MVGRLILRGLLLGLVAGVLAFGFARAAGEPLVEQAIGVEATMSHAHGDGPEAEIVSRATQAGIGLLTGTLAVGTALGGLFALAFALAHGRLGRLGSRETAALLAVGGFLVLALVPMLKYPANPPSIGEPGTIGLRTALYFELLAVSIAAAGVAVALARGLAASLGSWNANLAGLALFVVMVGTAMALMPAVDEVPDHFPATLLWQFRLAALGLQAVIWAALGLGFGPLAERVVADAVRVEPGRLGPRRRLGLRR